MRNEAVEELNTVLVSEHRPEQGALHGGGSKSKGMEREKGRKEEESRSRKANEAKRLRSEKHACPRERTREATESVGQPVVNPVVNPSEAAKRSGTPNSRIVTRPAVSGRALRANRCAQVRRA